MPPRSLTITVSLSLSLSHSLSRARTCALSPTHTRKGHANAQHADAADDGREGALQVLFPGVLGTLQTPCQEKCAHEHARERVAPPLRSSSNKRWVHEQARKRDGCGCSNQHHCCRRACLLLAGSGPLDYCVFARELRGRGRGVGC